MEQRVARKIVVDKAPNRLFLKYLSEWRDEAKERGDKSAFTYGKALKSLQKYPLPLQCGSEAKILENVGDKICKMLDDRLEKDAEKNSMSAFKFLENSRKVPESWWEKVNQEAPVATKKPTKRKKPQQNDTAEQKKSNQQLTLEKAFGLPTEHVETLQTANIMSHGSPHDSASSILTCTETFSLQPGQFEVILCVDTRETMGDKRKKQIKVELDRQNISYDQRTLNLGDFLWVAREKTELCGVKTPKELVLDYIIERKILSDLSMSICDGRFREQKIRLKNSGISNIIYLIENISGIENQSIPEQTLRQAIYNTEIVDQISVKHTKNAKATVLYLDIMTKQLKTMYENSTLSSSEDNDSQEPSESRTKRLCTFAKFNETGSKQKKLTVKELFLRQLMQIHGMSYDKAFAITSIYETPRSLVQKYKSLENEKSREALLSKIKTGLAGRNLGIAMSRSVYKLFA